MPPDQARTAGSGARPRWRPTSPARSSASGKHGGQSRDTVAGRAPSGAFRPHPIVSCTTRTGPGKRGLNLPRPAPGGGSAPEQASAPQRGKCGRRCRSRVRPSRPQFNGRRAKSVRVRRPAIVRWHTTPGARRRRSRNAAQGRPLPLRGVAPRQSSNPDRPGGIPIRGTPHRRARLSNGVSGRCRQARRNSRSPRVPVSPTAREARRAGWWRRSR